MSRRRLGKACSLLGLTPKGLIDEAQSNPKQFQDSLEDLVLQLEDAGRAPGYIANLTKIIKQWLKYNNVILTRHIKIRNSQSTPTIQDEIIPSAQELAKILRNSSSRVRLAEALMAFGDLRPESLRNFDGSDGLTLRDFPELRIDVNEVIIDRIPTRVLVRATLSKAKHPYCTFLGVEGCAYLKEYLEERLRNGEALQLSSPVIGHERTDVETRPFMLTRKITHLIRKSMRKAGVRRRPYVLRCYAETALTIAESKRKISHAYLQFFAGHKGDVEATYSTRKGVLPQEMIESMREAYRQCEPFLSTLAAPADQLSVVKEAKIEALKSLAKSMFDIDLLEVKVAKERSAGRELVPDETISLFETEMCRFRKGHKSQEIISEDELGERISDGWEFVSALPSQRILVKRSLLA